MEYKSFMEALKGNQHKIDKNKNGKVDAHDFKLLRKEESELNEGTADELGDSIDNAKSTEHAKSIIAKAPTKHLQYLHHWNMGLSGARTHKDMPHIKAELTSRKAVLSNAESSKRFDEQVDLEEATVKTQKYEWGTMKTVHHGSDFSIPLHPEHHQEIAKLKDQQEHKFKTEDGKHWTAKRSGDDVHFQGANGGNSTTVKHSTMSESVEELDEIARMKTKLTSLDNVSHMSVARQKLTNLMKSGKARGALIANKRRTLNMGDDIDQTDLEQIDELSKSTLGSYAKKASRDATITRKIGADFENRADRARSPGMKDSNTELSSKYKQKSWKRRDGLEKAVDRLTKEEVEQIEEKSDQAKQNKTMKNMMDASRGARYKLNNPVPDAEPEHKTAQAHNKAIGRALRNEDKMTTQKDKNGKLISFKYEGDWKKTTKADAKKDPAGKVANMAGQAMQKMKQANEQAPVAPVPDRKYIKGTPENKALKDSRKPINGMPTGKMKEEVEQIDEISDTTLNSYKDKVYTNNRAASPSSDELRRRMKGVKGANQRLNDRFAKRKSNMRNEAKDEQEYGYEGDMAMNQLSTLIRCAEMIKDTLKPDTDLPEWVQSKITLATDYIQTAADYLHSELEEGYYEKPASAYRRKGDEVGGGSSKAVEVKVNHAGDAPHEEKWEAVKKIKKPVKESFDDEGNLIPTKISYKDFITEIKLADLPVRRIQGHSYGANYSDPEGADDYDDKKPMKPAAEKRGRGRPAGAQSGARKNLGNSKLHSK